MSGLARSSFQIFGHLLGGSALLLLGQACDSTDPAGEGSGSTGGAETGGQASGGVSGSLLGAGGKSGVTLVFGEVRTLATGIRAPIRLALTNESVFVVEARVEGAKLSGEGDLVRFPRKGGPGQRASSNPVDFPLASDGQHVVFQDRQTEEVVVLSGAGIEEKRLETCGLTWLEAIALEGARVAWATGTSLRLADGTTDACLAPISTSGTGHTVAARFACASKRFYYANYGIPAETSTIGLFEQGEGGVFSETLSWPLDSRPRDIATVGDALFVSLQDAGSVVALQTPCGSSSVASAPVTLAKELRTPWGIATDERYVYVAEKGTVDATTLDCTTKEGRLSAIDRTTGEVRVLADGLDCPLRVAVDDEAVYWIEQGTIGQATGRLAYVEKAAP